MPADNTLYDIHASGWWNEDHFLHMLKTGINPARVDYFQRIFDRESVDPVSLRVLDIGCGGGILSEELAHLGCSVTGIDLSMSTISTALGHARSTNLEIDYHVGSAVNLPFADSSFEVVVCCDVLEHLTHPETAVAEAARVLRPGGLYLFDTINRTQQSYVENILVAQEMPLTRFFAPGTHDWNQFISPEELAACLNSCHLSLQEVSGLKPGISPNQTLLEIMRLKLGKINFAEFGRRLKFHHGGSLDSSYIGYAVKNKIIINLPTGQL